MQRLEAAVEEETNAVEELLHRTMPDAKVLSVQRNQHDRASACAASPIHTFSDSRLQWE